MKIAVLLFGHMRTYEYCYPYLKMNLLDRFECDIFIHTWDEMDSKTIVWDNHERFSKKLTNEDIAKIKKLYHPKKILIETQEQTEDVILKSKIDSKTVSLNGMRHMFQSMSKANTLRKNYEKETGSKYDIILVTRPDIALYKNLPIIKSIKEAKMLGYKIDNCRFFTGLSNVSKSNVALMVHRGCDMLFWGKDTAIDNFIKSNEMIDEIFAKEHFHNVVSVYVANELKFGNIPLLVCFKFGQDWKNIRAQDIYKKQKSKNKTKIYKFLHFYWLRGKK